MSAIVKIRLVIFLMIWAGLGVVNAQEYTHVQASAATLIRGNDLDGSRLTALAEAKKRCVKEVLRSDILKPAVYQKHSQKLEKIFLSEPSPYIARLDIENEEIVDGGQRYRVNVSANIRKGAMNAALMEEGIADVLSIGPKPTVMVLLRERFETRVSGTRKAETVLIQQLHEKGFTVTDSEQKKLVDLRNRLFAQGTGNIKAALQAAMSFKADYLIFGEAVVTSSGTLGGTDLKARYANMSLKIVESSSGRILAVESSQGKTKHIDELTGGNWALEEAAQKAGEKVLKRFESILKEELLAGAPIVVDLYGLDFASQAQEAESVLKEVDNVSSLTRRFYFSGVGQFEIKYKGTVAGLVQALNFTEIDGQPLEVIETLPRYLRIKRTGSKKTIPADTQEVFKRYLNEKYKYFDMEKAREVNTELITRINELAKNQKINDQQRKQLHASRKEIEEKAKEAYYRQQELKKREEELRKAEEEKKAIEKRLEAMENEAQDSKEQQQQLRQELQGASQRTYVASNNFSNASQSASMGAGDMINAMNQGVELAQGFSNLVGGGGLGGFGGLGGLF